MLSTLMLVGLGFLSASLVTVLIVPWVWRRAVTVTGRRLQFAAPDSVLEVQASRDQLRAEHALATRKLELRLQELKDKLAQQAISQAESTRLIDQLQVELEEKEKEIAKRGTEIEQQRASMSPMESELSSRTATVQHLRETVRRFEDKIKEQDNMIQQTVEAAGLKEPEIEALREASRLADTGKVLLPGLDSTRETLTEQVTALAQQAEQMEQRRADIFAQEEQVERQKSEIANSKSISAEDAKEYQSRISALEGERIKLDAELKDAHRRFGDLRRDISELDAAWRNRDNPYSELLGRVDMVGAEVERVSKVLNREGIVKSVLAALPGGKSVQKRPQPKAVPAQPPAVAVVPAPAPAETAPAKPAQPQLPVVKPEEPAAPKPETKVAQVALSIAKLGEEEPPALVPAKKPEPAADKAQPQSRRARTLAERIRALQSEMS